MTNEQPIIDDCELLLLVQEIHKRGNDMEIKHTKDGIKIMEVNRRVVKEVKYRPQCR